MTSIHGFYRVVSGYKQDDPLGVAYAPLEADHLMVWDGEQITDWSKVRFVLKDGPYADYQGNDLGWRLCSEKLRHIIEAHADEQDKLKWLDAIVVAENGEMRDYYILYFSEPLPLDILDKKKTIFNPNDLAIVVRPCLNITAIGNHKVFTYIGGCSPWFVSTEVRDAIIAANCTGIELAKSC
ncbi:MAG: DUF1629 domain-containing protein [Bacillota bacterium]